MSHGNVIRLLDRAIAPAQPLADIWTPPNELAPEFVPVNKLPFVDKTTPIVCIDGRFAASVDEAFRLMHSPSPGLYPPMKKEPQA